MSRGVIDSSLATIGDTPVVRLHRIVPDGSAQVLVKIEAGNPTGSYKDRMALAIIEEAERSDRDSASWSTPAEHRLLSRLRLCRQGIPVHHHQLGHVLRGEDPDHACFRRRRGARAE